MTNSIPEETIAASKAKEIYEAINDLVKAFNRLSEAWLKCDEDCTDERGLIETLTKHFPTSFGASIDDMAYDAYIWLEKVQKEMQQENPKIEENQPEQ